MSASGGLLPVAPTPPLLPAPPSEQPAPLGRGTLGRQLVIRVTALVALAAILLSAATALAARQLLLNQIDGQLDGVSYRAQRADPRGQGTQRQLLAPGQPSGSLAALVSTEGAAGQLLTDDGPESLSAASLAALLAVAPDSGKQSVQLLELGHYRLVSRPAELVVSGEAVDGYAVWGLPLNAVDKTLVNLVGLELVLRCSRWWGPPSPPGPSCCAACVP